MLFQKFFHYLQKHNIGSYSNDHQNNDQEDNDDDNGNNDGNQVITAQITLQKHIEEVIFVRS